MISEKDAIENLKNSLTKGYKELHVYIYTELASISVLKFIKEFQLMLDSVNLGSQVVVVNNSQLKKVGINNLFQLSKLPNWNDMSPNEFCIKIVIKKEPEITPFEMKELLVKYPNYDSEYFTFLDK